MNNWTNTTILLLPFYLFWFIQMLPKSCQLVLYGVWVVALVTKYGMPKLRSLDAYAVLQMIYIVAYGISIAMNAPQGHETSRILAACNTWGITVLALYAYLLYKRGYISLDQIGKASLINLLILIVLALLYLTPLSGIRVLGRTLSGFDYLNGSETTRFKGLMDYTNLIVFAVLFFWPAAAERLKRKPFCSIALCIGICGAVLLTNSRTGMVLIPVMCATYYLSLLYERSTVHISVRWLALGILCCLVIATILYRNQILSIIEHLYTMRASSNRSRTLIYTGTLERIQESPIFGGGIKDTIGETGYVYYYGSHSSYLGAFYKAGIVGGTAYLASFIVMAVQMIRRHKAGALEVTYAASFMLAFVLMILEDIDGVDWLAMMAYSLWGMYAVTSFQVDGRREQ